MNLPEDLKSFLKNRESLEYDADFCECGMVEFLTIEELEIGKVWLNCSTDNEDMYIEIPAISLLKKCEGYDPEYLLLYLPNENLYGSWDIDHWNLLVYPDIQWSEFVVDPVIYLNAQWEDTEYKYSRKYKPKSRYKKISGWPI